MNSLIDTFGDGIGFLTFSHEALESFLQMPEYLIKKIDKSGFTVAININRNSINFASKIELNDTINNIENEYETEFNLIAPELNNAIDIAIINEPNKLVKIDEKSGKYSWLEKIANELLKDVDLQASKDLITVQSGPLIYIRKEGGWIIESFNKTNLSNIETHLTQRGFIKTELQLKDRIYKVWHKLLLENISDQYQISSKLGIISLEHGDKTLWSNNIAILEDLYRNENINTFKNVHLTTNEFLNTNLRQKVLLGSKSAQKLLINWKPWQLMKIVSGGIVQGEIDDLFLGIGTEEQKDTSRLNFDVKLSLK